MTTFAIQKPNKPDIFTPNIDNPKYKNTCIIWMFNCHLIGQNFNIIGCIIPADVFNIAARLARFINTLISSDNDGYNILIIG